MVLDSWCNWADLANLVEASVMEEPESSKALAITCLPPGPLISTLLVIIRQLGGDNELVIGLIGLVIGLIGLVIGPSLFGDITLMLGLISPVILLLATTEQFKGTVSTGSTVSFITGVMTFTDG